jgi:hypothetical protein
MAPPGAAFGGRGQESEDRGQKQKAVPASVLRFLISAAGSRPPLDIVKRRIFRPAGRRGGRFSCDTGLSGIVVCSTTVPVHDGRRRTDDGGRKVRLSGPRRFVRPRSGVDGRSEIDRIGR